MCADGIRADDHALEYAAGVPLQQHAVLEGARLALVGVDHEVLVCTRRTRRALPLDLGGEGRAAAPQQPRHAHCVNDLRGRHAGQHLAQPLQPARRLVLDKRGAPPPPAERGDDTQVAPHIILAVEVGGRAPLARKGCFHLVGRYVRESGVAQRLTQRHVAVGDVYRDAGVAVAKAGRALHRDGAAGRGAAHVNARQAAGRGKHRLTAAQRARRVSADAHHRAPHRFAVEHGVEINDAVHVHQRHMQGARNFGGYGFGNPAKEALRVLQGRQQGGASAGCMARQKGAQPLQIRRGRRGLGFDGREGCRRVRHERSCLVHRCLRCTEIRKRLGRGHTLALKWVHW